MRENPAHQGIQLHTFVLPRPCGIAVPYTCRCKESDEFQRLIQGGKHVLHYKSSLKFVPSADRSQDFGATCSDWMRKSRFWIASRGLHGAISLRCLQKLFFPFGSKGETPLYWRAALIFARPSAIVFEFAAVLNRAAKLRIWIPNKSIPRPHTDPARRRSEGEALQGPAVIHCNAWASSFEGCSIKCGNGSQISKYR